MGAALQSWECTLIDMYEKLLKPIPHLANKSIIKSAKTVLNIQTYSSNYVSKHQCQPFW